MGYKAIVVFDLDHLDNIKNNPEGFAQEIVSAILRHSRMTPTRANLGGATVAEVVHKCHVDAMPLIAFDDLNATIMHSDVTGMSVRVKA